MYVIVFIALCLLCIGSNYVASAYVCYFSCYSRFFLLPTHRVMKGRGPDRRLRQWVCSKRSPLNLPSPTQSKLGNSIQFWHHHYSLGRLRHLVLKWKCHGDFPAHLGTAFKSARDVTISNEFSKDRKETQAKISFYRLYLRHKGRIE